jgi:mRNA interferase RelE/StbE
MFEVLLHAKARKVFERLPRKAVRLVEKAFRQLEQDPFFGPQIQRLHGPLAGLYRFRVGAYRIVYEIQEEKHVVVVFVIGSRGNVY